MNSVLAFKLALVPLLIGAVTLAGRRWGPAVAGWLSGFPIVTGPILFFITLEQGAAFGSTAALGTLAGLPAILAFNLAYAWTSVRHDWPLSLACAVLAYALAVNGLVALQLPASVLVVLVAVLLVAAPRLFPHIAHDALSNGRKLGNADVFFRMLAAAVLVYAVTHFAAAMGPRWSGVMAMFPVISIVMAPFSQHYCGHGFAVRLLRGVILGWYALVAFCLLLFLLLPQVAFWPAILLASAGAIGVQAASRFIALRGSHA